MPEFWFNFEPVGTSRGFVTKLHGSEEYTYELSVAQLEMVEAFLSSQQNAFQRFLQGVVE